MKKINIKELENLLQEMRKLQAQHEKANDICFDFENNTIDIYYPIPKDFKKVKQIRIMNC